MTTVGATLRSLLRFTQQRLRVSDDILAKRLFLLRYWRALRANIGRRHIAFKPMYAAAPLTFDPCCIWQKR